MANGDPSSVTIIESVVPPAYIVELRPTDAEVPGITYPDLGQLPGGHGIPGESEQATAERELREELVGLNFVHPPELLWSQVTESREGAVPVDRRVSLFGAVVSTAAGVKLNPDNPKLRGDVLIIPKNEQQLEAHKGRLTPFAYAALKHHLSGASWEGWDPKK